MPLILLIHFVTPNYVPVCGMPYKEYTVEAQPDGTYTGVLYESASCSAGGRGSKPNRYAVCEAMTWNADGSVLANELIWRDTGKSVRGPAECFAP